MNLKTDFSVRIARYGTVRFKLPSFYPGAEVDEFVKSDLPARAAYIKFLSRLVESPKLSSEALAQLSDWSLHNIGMKLLESQRLLDEYEKLKAKRQHGDFYRRIQIIYKTQTEKQQESFKNLIKRFESPVLSVIRQQEAVYDQLKRMVQPYEEAVRTTEGLADIIDERNRCLQVFTANSFIEEIRRIDWQQRELLESTSRPYREFVYSTNRIANLLSN